MQTWGTGLRHYTWVIRNWLWLILLGTIITTGTTYLVNKNSAPVYQASALIQVNGTGNPNSNDVFSRQAVALTYSLLVTDADVLRVVSQKVPGVSVSQLKKTVSDSPLDNSQIIEVRAQANDPQKAADIANAIATTFIEMERTSTSTRLKNVKSQISKSLTTAKQAISTDEGLLANLQQSHAPQDQVLRQQDILTTDQANYNSLLTSYNTAQQEDIQAATILGIAQTATAPETPTSPQTTLNTIIAALLSLLLMITLVVLLDWLDVTIQTPEDVTNVAMLESLGSMPFSKYPQLVGGSLAQAATKDIAIEETFTILSESFGALSKGRRSILVTGLRPGVGITTTAINLAISLALTGKHVLLIDANLRRPMLHEIFQHSNTTGLASNLMDVNRFHKDVVLTWLNQWRTAVPNLWLLPAGSTVNDPMVIMRSSELRQLVGWLLGKNQSVSANGMSGVVDFIIFDTPSLKESADALALSGVTDGTILVVEAGKERKEMLDNAATILQRLSSPLLGVLVNRQKTKHRPYFYVSRRQHNATIAESLPSLEVVPEISLSINQSSLPDATIPVTPSIDAYQNGSPVPSTSLLGTHKKGLSASTSSFHGTNNQNDAAMRITPLQKTYQGRGPDSQVGG